MKIVLINKVTGRYYHAPGQWVRRADNALVFDNVTAAVRFSRLNHLSDTLPVARLAPYMMRLLQDQQMAFWKAWRRGQATQWAEWLSETPERFSWN